MRIETNDIPITERILAFDVLRAIMLFSLFIFHSGVSFMETKFDAEIWVYKNESTNIIFDGLLGFIHTFRHPTFFIISGFVTEMMYRRYTPNSVLKRRFQRLFIPFLITVVFIGPFVAVLLAQLIGQQNSFSTEVMFPPTETSSWSLTTSFTWFLYYLVLFNCLHYVFHRLKFKKRVNDKSPRPIRLYATVFVLAVTVSIALYFWGENSLFGLYSFFPDLGSIGGYFLFYIAGIYLFRNAGDLEVIKSRAWLLTVIGFISVCIFFALGKQKLDANISTVIFDWGIMLTSTFASIFLSYAGIGLALKYYRKPHKIITYVSRSSYFLYLIHFPFVLILLQFVAPQPWGAVPKFLVILSLTILIIFTINYLWIKAWKNKPPI